MIVSGMMSEFFYRHYEDGSQGGHMRSTAAGAFCGNGAFNAMNSFIWRQEGGKFSTDQYKDLCLAFKGKIDEMHVEATWEKRLMVYHNLILSKFNFN